MKGNEKVMFQGVLLFGICLILVLVICLQYGTETESHSRGDLAAERADTAGRNIEPEIDDALAAEGGREPLKPHGGSLTEETLDGAEQSNLGEGVIFGAENVIEGIAVPEELRQKIPTDYGRSKSETFYKFSRKPGLRDSVLPSKKNGEIAPIDEVHCCRM